MAAPDCAICMMPLTNPPCGPCGDHTFCLGCLQAALAVHRECPTCRVVAHQGWTPRPATFLRGVLESAAATAGVPPEAKAAVYALQMFLQAHSAAQRQLGEMAQRALVRLD